MFPDRLGRRGDPVAQIGSDWHFQVGQTTRDIARDYEELVRS